MEQQSEKLTLNLESSFRLSSRTSIRNTDGVALVIVLGFLVLLTVLIIAFFTNVSTEYNATKTYTAGASTRFLTDSAVNLVMGQINKATQGQQPNSQIRYTWASQPGMIRTYGDKDGAGSSYKLYSAASMVVDGNAKDVPEALAADLPAGWNSMPANFTDLNAPVIDAGGKLNFPILDGDLKQIQINGADLLTYDENGDGLADIEGFGISPATVPNYSPTLPVSATNNPAPMPVQWLYLLKDGTLTAPDLPGAGGSSVKATWKSAPDAAHTPTAANPIVGRVAFWTDDETSKLNINTACEGSYFASPRMTTKTDMKATGKTFGFAVAPPARGEYNRYPGHPANTCLSVALGNWLDPLTLTGKTTPNAYTTKAADEAYLGLIGGANPTLPAGPFSGLSAYMLLSPRNALGGSVAGTVDATPPVPPNTTSYKEVTSDSDRLFASVDELIFRAPATSDTGPATDPRPEFPGRLTKSSIDTLRFFLTASSRAPDLTPFNTPKVSLWPQYMAAADRSNPAKYRGGTTGKLQSDLLAFCSSFGQGNTFSPSQKFEYFYQRSAGTTNSSTADWTTILPPAKSSRNQLLANYLCRLGNEKIPGYEASFRKTNGGKYSDITFSNIVLESIDYIRSNLASDSTGAGYIYPLLVTSGLPGVSTTTPIKGFGHFPIIPQIVIGEALEYVAPPPPPPPPALPPPPPPPKPTAFLAVQFFDTGMSYPGINASVSMKVTGLTKLDITHNTNGAPIADSLSFGMFNWNANDSNKNAAVRVYTHAFNGYTFPITPGSPKTVTIGGGPVTFSFYDSSNTEFQKITLKFPAVTLPLPTKSLPNSMHNNGDGWVTADVAKMIFNESGEFTVARGMESGSKSNLASDWRLIGSMVNADGVKDPGLYHPAEGYSSDSSQALSLYMHNLSSTQGVYLNGAKNTPTSKIAGSLSMFGDLLKSKDYAPFSVPYVAAGLGSGVPGTKKANNYLGKPGDWDTGPGRFCDGPFINPVEQMAVMGTGTYYDNYWAGTTTYQNLASLSPNRRISSAVSFGSLPTGVSASSPQPWQTLLFCPNPAARLSTDASKPSSAAAGEHLGFVNPPDHLYLEFFTMPIVEPYPISEPLSTAGKVNLNYQLAPFTNIERSTALRGVLKNVLVTGISGKDIKGASGGGYKGGSVAAPYPGEFRYDINRNATLEGITRHYFNKGSLFKYPSEICDVFLVPQRLTGAAYMGAVTPTKYDDMIDWWNSTANLTAMGMTGDNLREEPYGRLYPRLTTRSNSYTVHYRVQILQKNRATKADEWVEGKDVVTAEHRGSSLIERYVDPNDTALNANWDTNTMNVDFDASTTAKNSPDLSKYYKFRVISTKQFAP